MGPGFNLCVAVIAYITQLTSAAVDFGYHDYKDLTAWLVKVNRTYPHIAHLHSIGRSVQGQGLW